MYEKELQDELERRRYDDTLTIQFYLPIERQLDKGQAVTFADLSKLFSAWERYSANSSLIRILPDCPGLYMFVWSPDAPFKMSTTEGSEIEKPFNNILYVGLAETSIKDRFQEYLSILKRKRPQNLFEVSDSTRAGRFQKYLSIYPLQFWWTSLQSKRHLGSEKLIERVKLLKNIEERVIKFFNPPINDQHTIKARVGKQEEAWGENR
jgi:hypothetical protein